MRNLIGAKRAHLAALAVAISLIVVLFVAHGLTTDHNNTAQPVTPRPAPSASPAPSGAITLVSGSHDQNGIRTGYPHTSVGAVSAAVEYLDAVGSTLDPDYAAAVMRVAGDPSESTLPARLSQSTEKLRADLQLPTAGPLSPPTAFQTTAEMYQLRDTSSDSVVVLLLASGTFTSAQGGVAQTTGVFPVLMRWVSTDWRMAAVGGGPDYSRLDAAPYTAEALSQGWSTLIAAPAGDGS